MERVIGYIDGYNLYYGLRSKHWQRYYWLNLQRMMIRLLKPAQTLQRTKYFTARVSDPPDKVKRQNTYLEALGTLSDLDIFYGHFLEETITCRNCGHTYKTHHEKMTDVNIALQMLTDAYQNAFDTALLVSADSDLVGPLRTIQTLFPAKKVVVVFPPARRSAALQKTAYKYAYLGQNALRKSQFPDQVVKANGFVLRRPPSWK